MTPLKGHVQKLLSRPKTLRTTIQHDLPSKSEAGILSNTPHNNPKKAHFPPQILKLKDLGVPSVGVESARESVA